MKLPGLAPGIRRNQAIDDIARRADRLYAARTALAVSRALEKDALNPFCRALFTHALKGRLEEKQQDAPPRTTPSGLVTP